MSADSSGREPAVRDARPRTDDAIPERPLPPTRHERSLARSDLTSSSTRRARERVREWDEYWAAYWPKREGV